MIGGWDNNGKREHGRKYTIVILVTTAVIFIFGYHFPGMYYGVNDDTSMRAIASGVYTGVPDGHTVYIRYVLGMVIAFMYKISNTIDWYGGLQILIIYVSCGLVVIRLFDITHNMREKLLVRICGIGVLTAVLLKFILLFQFTTTAGIAGAAAVFLLATDRKEDMDLTACGEEFLLLMLAYLIRKKVCLMCLPFAAILILFRIRKDKFLKYYLTGIVLFVAFVVGTDAIEVRAYASNDWKEYAAYKSYRSQIVDYAGFPEYEENEALYESINVSREEYEILESSFGILPDIDANDLKIIAEYQSESNESHSISAAVALLKSCIQNKNMCTGQKLLAMLALVLAAGTCIFRKTSRRDKCRKVLLIALSMAELMYLAWNGRLPERVMFVWALLTVASIMGIILNEEWITWKVPVLPGAVCVLLVSGLNIYNMVVLEGSIESYNKELIYYDEYNTYLSEHSESTYVTATGTINSRRKFVLCSGWEKNNSIGTSGWSSQLPLLLEWERARGLCPEEMILVQENVKYMTVDMKNVEDMTIYLNSIGYMIDYEIVDFLNLSNGKQIYVIEWR